MSDKHEQTPPEENDQAPAELDVEALENVTGGVKVDFDPSPLNH